MSVMGIEPMTYRLQGDCNCHCTKRTFVDFSTPYPLEDSLSPFLPMTFLMHLVDHIIII